MKWYQVKERAAGRKRLALTWWIYKIFGKSAVKLIAFFVTLMTFLFAKDLRKYSKINLEIIGVKSTLKNIFKNFYNYALTLVDKIEVYSGNFDFNKIEFENKKDKEELFEDFENKKGLFFVCSHIGNIEVMRTFVTSKEDYKNTEVCVFLSNEGSRIFNERIKKITVKSNIKAYPVEEIDLNTSIEVKEKLDRGGIVFIAGDRIAKYNNSAVFEGTLFNKIVEFPKGSLKLAQLMNVPTYFVAALKDGEKYIIHLKKAALEGSKQAVTKKMQEDYLNFIEEKTLIDPLQFYHFYNLFH